MNVQRHKIICAPEPRTLELIFTPEKLEDLRARYELIEVQASEVGSLDPKLLSEVLYHRPAAHFSQDTGFCCRHCGQFLMLKAT